MATAQGVALHPNSEAPRQPGQAERGTGCLLAGNIVPNTLIAHRLQLLRHRHGVHGGVAITISTAFWGEVDHV